MFLLDIEGAQERNKIYSGTYELFFTELKRFSVILPKFKVRDLRCLFFFNYLTTFNLFIYFVESRSYVHQFLVLVFVNFVQMNEGVII